MRNAEMIDYLDSVVAPSSPHLRGADILDPLWATDSHRATQRERVLRLCSDYGSGAEERRSGRPVDVEALPMGYRLYAYMLLHRAIFSPTFFNNIRKAINIETPVSMSRVQDTPFILQRLPELDSGLTSEYALE